MYTLKHINNFLIREQKRTPSLNSHWKMIWPLSVWLFTFKVNLCRHHHWNKSPKEYKRIFYFWTKILCCYTFTFSWRHPLHISCIKLKPDWNLMTPNFHLCLPYVLSCLCEKLNYSSINHILKIWFRISYANRYVTSQWRKYFTSFIIQFVMKFSIFFPQFHYNMNWRNYQLSSNQKNDICPDYISRDLFCIWETYLLNWICHWYDDIRMWTLFLLMNFQSITFIIENRLINLWNDALTWAWCCCCVRNAVKMSESCSLKVVKNPNPNALSWYIFPQISFRSYSFPFHTHNFS